MLKLIIVFLFCCGCSALDDTEMDQIFGNTEATKSEQIGDPPAPPMAPPASYPIGDPKISYTKRCWLGSALGFCASHWPENPWSNGVVCPNDVNPKDEYCYNVAYADYTPTLRMFYCCRNFSPPYKPEQYP